MDLNFLDFEQPIAEIEGKIEKLRHFGTDEELNITEEIDRLQKKSKKLTESIYASLSEWQIVQIARHPNRPHTRDYIELIFDSFQELHGDRMYADDQALIGGLARLDNRGIVVIGHEKGRETDEKIEHNFGMPRPEGYRKAQRLMKLAERFSLPVFTFIDTPGAYPGIGAEERGQSEAIARSLFIMSELKTPIISAVTGEGGSGGALAIGVCDRMLMLEYAIYATISPEGCASILWKSADMAADAAVAMGLTSKHLLDNELIEEVVKEPPGGAHRDVAFTAQELKRVFLKHLRELDELSPEALLENRHKRFMSIGKFHEKN